MSKVATIIQRFLPCTKPKPGRSPTAIQYCTIDGVVESPYRYRPGPHAYHPVHLGDVLNQQYRIIRQLGFGQYSTVWLARDLGTTRYVALKVGVTAEEQSEPSELELLPSISLDVHSNHPGRKHIQTLQHHFKLTGPNGFHQCFVFEPAGRDLQELIVQDISRQHRSSGSSSTTSWSLEFSRTLSKQLLLALDYLHSHRIIHRDLQPGNILLNLTYDLNEVDEEETEPVFNHVEKVFTHPLERIDGSNLGDSEPHYLVGPLPIHDRVFVSEKRPNVSITLSDLGAAKFERASEPAGRTPMRLRAPEIVVGGPIDSSADIWNVGCVIFQLVTLRNLFSATIGITKAEHDDGHLIQMAHRLGPLTPKLLFQWTRSTMYFKPDGSHIDPPPDEEKDLSLEDAIPLTKPTDMSDAEVAQFLSFMRQTLSSFGASPQSLRGQRTASNQGKLDGANEGELFLPSSSNLSLTPTPICSSQSTLATFTPISSKHSYKFPVEHTAIMVDPMNAFKKHPSIPTSIPASIKPTHMPTILPGTTPEYQEASHVGTQTLWVVFVLMLLSSIAFYAMAFRVPVQKRMFHILTAFITTFATLSYYAMAIKDGVSQNEIKIHHDDKHFPYDSIIYREVYWARYVDWSVTTPLLLLDLCFLAGLAGANILVAVVADVIMILTGLFAAFTVESGPKWGWYAMACLAYLIVVYQLAINGRHVVMNKDKKTSTFFMSIAGFTFVLWTIYPIVWGIADGSRNVSVDGEIIAYAVLDILAKPVFGFWLLFTHDNMSSSASIEGFWAHGLSKEGSLTVGEEDDGA